MKARTTAKFQVALGQVGLLVSLLLGALLLGLVPDRENALRHGRAALAETIALDTSILDAQESSVQFKDRLELIVNRTEDLKSAAVRTINQQLAVEVGQHETFWKPMRGEHSSRTQVRVPIFRGQEKWGHLELRFGSESAFGVFTFAHSQVVALIAYLSVAGFFVFYFYLGRMLRHLDPTRAIPARVKSALDTMAEGLLVLDLDGNIVLANSAFAEMVGKEVDAILGQKSFVFGWESEDGSAVSVEDAPWIRCLKTGIAERNQSVCLYDANVQRRTFLVNCSPVMTTDQQHGGVLVSLDDVTQLEEKKVELASAKEEAEAANRAKSDFLANMSHEIRTPMNAILGFTDILRRGYGRSDQDNQKHLNTIHSSGTHLLGLINDILDLSKVEAGQLEVERIACSPHKIVREVIRVLAVKANEKGIDLSFEAAGAIPETIQSDPSRLRQVITNLVGNAIQIYF